VSRDVLIRRIDPELPLPEYKTAGAAAFDLYARYDVAIAAGSLGTVPLNVAIKVPEGHWIMFAARSSLHKKGLMQINGIAVMDADFCGNDDEYRVVLYNFGETDVLITKGERIVQATVMQLNQYPIVAVDELPFPNRGGFGTTSTH
jgi:dUTP pyrophosphatase